MVASGMVWLVTEKHQNIKKCQMLTYKSVNM